MILVECPRVEVRVARKSCWKIFRRRVILTVVVAPERLCDDWSEAQSFDGSLELTTRRDPNPNIPKLFYGSDTMLRENELCILINLQRRKNTYIYSSVRAKRKQS